MSYNVSFLGGTSSPRTAKNFLLHLSQKFSIAGPKGDHSGPCTTLRFTLNMNWTILLLKIKLYPQVLAVQSKNFIQKSCDTSRSPEVHYEVSIAWTIIWKHFQSGTIGAPCFFEKCLFCPLFQLHGSPSSTLELHFFSSEHTKVLLCKGSQSVILIAHTTMFFCLTKITSAPSSFN